MDRRGDVDHDRTKDEHKGEGTVWASLKGVCVESSTGEAGQGRRDGTPSKGIIGFRDRVKASGREQAALGITNLYPDERKVIEMAYGNEATKRTDVRGKEGAPPDGIESSGRGRIPSILIEARAQWQEEHQDCHCAKGSG